MDLIGALIVNKPSDEREDVMLSGFTVPMGEFLYENSVKTFNFKKTHLANCTVWRIVWKQIHVRPVSPHVYPQPRQTCQQFSR